MDARKNLIPSTCPTEALTIGLIVGVSSFSIVYHGTQDISFSIIFSVVTGIFATYLSYTHFKKKICYEDSATKSCPVVGRLTLSDHGFFGPSTITWKTGSDPSIVIASLGAGLLQMLHPDVVRVIEKSGKVYKDPKTRGERTGLHYSSIIYGDKKTAALASEAFKRLHDSLEVENPKTGERYSASKPELLLWVHNSLTWVILRAFKTYGPVLTQEEEDQYVREQHIFAKLTGIEEKMLPIDTKELNAYMDKMIDQLALTKDSLRFRNFLVNKGFPRSVTAAVNNLFVSASIRLMLPIHQNLFGFKFSKLSNVTVQAVTALMIRIIRYGFPATTVIPKTRVALAEHSFGDHLLKK